MRNSFTTLLPLYAVMLLACLAGPAFAQAGIVDHPYDVQHYDLTLMMNPADSSIAGVCEITATSVDDTLQNARFDFRGLTVDSVLVDGRRAVFVNDGMSLYVHLYLVMPRLVNFVTKVYYHGHPGIPKNEQWGGVHWGDPTYSIGVGFTDTLISMTRLWMPCYDLPDDKATIDYHLTVPRPLVAGANGKLTRVDTTANFLTYHWHEGNPCATYLMNFAFGHYIVQKWIADSIPVEIYSLPADSAHSSKYFTFLQQALRTFQARFGPYPFDKVGYALTKLGGGMEHQSLISIDPQIIADTSYRSVGAHELGHQWWGDLVSPYEFKEAWLSEGFATFGESIFKESLTNKAAYQTDMSMKMSNYYTIASNEGILPLYNYPRNAPSSNYPSTIYNKGAAVLGMLRWIYDDSLFFRSLAVYRQQHQYASAKTADLRHAFELVTGDTLGWFFDEWVYRAGWPIIATRVQQTDSLHLTVFQRVNTTTHAPYRMPYDVRFILATHDTVYRRIIVEAVDSQTITLAPLAAKITKYTFDPQNHILGQHIDTALVGVQEQGETPHSAWLSQNFPNPVGPDAMTTICIDPLVYAMGIAPTLRLFDSVGRQVKDYSALLSGHAEKITLDVSDLPAGVYHYTLETATGRVSQEMTVTR